MEPTKKPLQSKTVWFNILLPLVAWGAYTATGQTVPPDVAAGLLAVVQTVGNIVLRLVTKQPISWE